MNIRTYFTAIFSATWLFGQLYSLEIEVVSIEKVWSKDLSSAFVSLAKYDDALFLAFRGSDLHAGGKEGVIRILEKKAEAPFSLKATLSKEGVDLRDPKLSITPKNELMITMGGSRYKEGKLTLFYPEVAFYSAKQGFSEVTTLPLPNEWIWGVSWWQEVGYGFSYGFLSLAEPKKGFGLKLFSTKNGLDFQQVASFSLENSPSEAALLIEKEGATALVRRWGTSLLGTSRSPFTSWQWKDVGARIEGPALIRLPTGELLAAGRTWKPNRTKTEMVPKTVLGKIGKDGFEELLELPSGGDTGYPALIWHEGRLLMAYYSSHEASHKGSSAIYLATLAIKN